MLLLSLLLSVQADNPAAAAPPARAENAASPDPAPAPRPRRSLTIPTGPPPPTLRYSTPPPPADFTPLSPRGSPGNWITGDDYPDAAYFGEWSGTTGFRLDVAPSGRPSGCTVTESSGHAELDDTTCTALMRRARFNPATDKGVAIAGAYRSRVHWGLPPEIFFIVDPDFVGIAPDPAILTEAAIAWRSSEVYPAAAQKTRPAGRTIVVLDVDAEGRVAGCSVDVPSGQRPLDQAACPLLAGKTLFEPGLDDTDQPVADRARIKLRWEPPAVP